MSYMKEPNEYAIFPLYNPYEQIPSRSEHEEHLKWLKDNGLDNFDSGIEADKTEQKRLNRLIQLNFDLHGDVRGVAVLHSRLKPTESKVVP